eukprot:6750868-Pyramimonas_sp.AAC.1
MLKTSATFRLHRSLQDQIVIAGSGPRSATPRISTARILGKCRTTVRMCAALWREPDFDEEPLRLRECLAHFCGECARL